MTIAECQSCISELIERTLQTFTMITFIFVIKGVPFCGDRRSQDMLEVLDHLHRSNKKQIMENKPFIEI